MTDEVYKTRDQLHAERRARVAVQVLARLRPDDDPTDEDMEAAERAADVVFRDGINDLDWEAEVLRLLDDGSSPRRN